jgi:hypothetical protein
VGALACRRPRIRRGSTEASNRGHPQVDHEVDLVGRYSNFPEPRALGDFTPAARPPRPVPRIHNAEKRLGPDLVAQLIADYRAGEPSTALMSKYQLGKGTVLGILENHGVARRGQPLTPEQCEEAIERYLAGWSMAKVGRHFGRAHTVIR